MQKKLPEFKFIQRAMKLAGLTIPAILAIHQELSAQSYSFSQESNLTITANSSDISVADFISGGRSEIVVAHASSYGQPGIISIFKYNTATSAWEVSGNLINAALSPQAIASADFDGDGKTDFATTHYCNCGDHTLYKGDGNGNFTAAITGYPAFNGNRFSYDATVGDINKDNKPDFITGGNAAVNLFQNTSTGSGNFSFSNISLSNADPTYNTGGLAVADFNGDGWNDVAAGKPGTSEVVVFLNSGTGTFSASTSYAIAVNVSQYTFGIAAGDLNGDAKPDLVATDNSGGKIGVLLNNGSGGFNISVNYSTGGASPNYPEIADMNGDGKKDIVVSHATGFDIFTNTGNGNFGPAYTYTSNNPVKRLALQDFNNDNKTDVAFITDATLQVVLNGVSVGVSNTNALNTFVVFPNPASNTLTINNSFNNNLNLEIYNALGELVYKEINFAANTLNLSQLPCGVYTLRVNDQTINQSATFKIIKE